MNLYHMEQCWKGFMFPREILNEVINSFIYWAITSMTGLQQMASQLSDLSHKYDWAFYHKNLSKNMIIHDSCLTFNFHTINIKKYNKVITRFNYLLHEISRTLKIQYIQILKLSSFSQVQNQTLDNLNNQRTMWYDISTKI